MQHITNTAMKVYKVGGAVRDGLLGYPHKETDWVVVGGTPNALLSQGYTQVGKDFPVFLHPDSKEEYALARTERKQGHGYHGFVVHAEPSVTLEEDLARRDLTINAMAMAENGDIIDPYGGRQDLRDKVLRHVSEHFVEDPLRVLRVARFAARYRHLGFYVAPETLALMTQIVTSGELHHLATERIWVETERALTEHDPAVFFEVLKSCGALAELAPALSVTHGIDHLATASPRTARMDCRWAALLAELSPDKARKTCEALKTPNAYRNLSVLVCEWRLNTKRALCNAPTAYSLLRALDALRRDEPFHGFVLTLAALTPDAEDAQAITDRLTAMRDAARGVDVQALIAQGYSGAALGGVIGQRQIAAIAEHLDCSQ